MTKGKYRSIAQECLDSDRREWNRQHSFSRVGFKPFIYGGIIWIILMLIGSLICK